MIFLIEYDRRKGQIESLIEFNDLDRSKAEKARLDLELDLNRRKVDHEVVLLEALSKEALHRTHRRYFEDAGRIASSTMNTTKTAE